MTVRWVIRLWFGLVEPVDRKAYLLSGVGLMVLKYAVDAIGSERIMYASDYPHEPTEEDLAADLPDFLADSDYSDTVKTNVVYKAAKRFYRLD